MKKLLAALIINLCFFHPLLAQTTSPAPQADSAKSAEIAEANRLSAQTVELYNKKQYDEAIPLAQRALEIREQALGPNNALVGDALENLSSLYFAKKDYGKAVSMRKRALAIYEKAYEPGNQKVAATLDTLGWIYYAEGDNGKAEETLQRSLTLREKTFGPAHRDVATSLQYLAQFYQKVAKYATAVDYYKRALEVLEKELGQNHMTVGELAIKCACAMEQDKQTKAAMEMHQRASKILNGPIGNPAMFSGQVTKSKPVYRTEPEYPLAAKKARITGAVVVEVVMDETGKVIHAQPLCGPDQLAEASVEAALKWRFTPTQLNGQPVKAVGIIQFHFTLSHFN